MGSRGRPDAVHPHHVGALGGDGDGDGRINPQDVDDAAYATGRYLCGTGKQLGSRDGWLRAVVTYNQSTAYVRKTSRTATSYADSSGRL